MPVLLSTTQCLWLSVTLMPRKLFSWSWRDREGGGGGAWASFTVYSCVCLRKDLSRQGNERRQGGLRNWETSIVKHTRLKIEIFLPFHLPVWPHKTEVCSSDHAGRPSPILNCYMYDTDMEYLIIKTPNPKCRLYWRLIEFIDWRYSQSCRYFRPLLWSIAPITFSLAQLSCIRVVGRCDLCCDGRSSPPALRDLAAACLGLGCSAARS
jgi:hypothetical protein